MRRQGSNVQRGRGSKGRRLKITHTVKRSKLEIGWSRFVKKISRMALYVFAAAGFVGLAWLVLR